MHVWGARFGGGCQDTQGPEYSRQTEKGDALSQKHLENIEKSKRIHYPSSQRHFLLGCQSMEVDIRVMQPQAKKDWLPPGTGRDSSRCPLSALGTPRLQPSETGFGLVASRL